MRHRGLHESMMYDTFRQYKNAIKVQNDTDRLKEQIATRFVWHVCEWAHVKFNKPKLSHQGLRGYLDAIYHELKCRFCNFGNIVIFVLILGSSVL